MRKIAYFYAIFVSLSLLMSPSIWAQCNKDIEIDGLIMDQTKTKIGHDFADNFALSWETTAIGYNMVIDEQADFLIGSWVSIEINGNLAFRAALRPNRDAIEELAEEAKADCNEWLTNQNEMVKALENEKDMKGDGI